MVAKLLLATTLAGVSAHGQLVHPRPRNSIDYLVGVNDPDGHQCANVSGDACHNGQAAFWYSQGCFIGCPTCDHVSGRRQTDLCKLGMLPTNNGEARSLNRNATPNDPADIYRHNPWRAPGAAPVADACGLAGGTPWGPNAPEEGMYTNTTFAHHGMRGTALPNLPGVPSAVWTRGGEATVAWNVRNNHGGGYSYRLCPASETPSEECFRKHPLDFVPTKQAILAADGTRTPIHGVFLRDGTTPPGSMWARLPIPATGLGPRCLPGPNDTNSTPHGCEPWEGRGDGHYGHVDGPCVPCPETKGSDCSRCSNPGWPGASNRSAFEPPVPGVVEAPVESVLDVLRVPADLPAGSYVLGWRYDCEGTAQVWSNCADVELVD